MLAAYKNIARVVRPHGTKGEVLVAPLRGLPLLLTESMQVHLTPPAHKRERTSTVESLSVTSEGARVRFSCAHTLDDAESMTGCYVLASCDDFELGRLDSAVGDLLLLLTESMQVHLTPPALKRERTSTVESLSVTSEGARVRFSGARNLADAESLTGCYVLASCDDFELGRLDSAVGDLLGRPVVDERVGDLGSIVEVMETPANDVWVLDGSSHGEVLRPVIDEVFVALPEEGAITVHILDGLLEL